MARKKRQKRRRERRSNKRTRTRRRAVIRDGDRRTVVEAATDKGYDVEMIHDFLEQLLLEVQVQQYENVAFLRALEETPDFESARAASAQVSESLCEQLAKYFKKYATALIALNWFDCKDATEDEELNATVVVLRLNIERRDEQILHMEALQSLFDEALLCAKLPCGQDANGEHLEPMVVHSVRDMFDRMNEAPDYDEMMRQFDGRSLTTAEGIRTLQEAGIILATNEAFGRLVIYGRAEVERIRASGDETVPEALCVEIADVNELQFLVAAVQKFKGRHDYLGNYYDEF